MTESLTLGGRRKRRIASLVAALGMIAAAMLTIQHFFSANYPESIWEGAFCDVGTFFNCDSSAYSSIATVAGVPIGTFGVMLGLLLAVGALFPSAELERTNKTLALVNGFGVAGHFSYSVLGLGDLCLLCLGYYVFSLASLILFWRFGLDRTAVDFSRRWLRPSPKVLGVFVALTLLQAFGVAEYHETRRKAQSGDVEADVVRQFYELPMVEWPSVVSPYWIASATDEFEDAAIRVVEYGDLLCPDCRYLSEQFVRLEREFAGQLNIAFQFFPLDAQCNRVVEKDKHPGACDLSYMAAFDPSKFKAIHDEIFANLEAARDPEWRSGLAMRHGVEEALTDSATIGLVNALIDTGAEYEKTSEEYSHGIRSTPTLIINNRMVIGTFPYEQLRAIFRALVNEQVGARSRFLENWEE
jgi:uncharacterized membrane protein